MEQARLVPLVSGDEIRTELRRRRFPKIFKTISASKPGLLEKKVALEEADGWTIDRKNKKSYRMARAKPLDEQLEDELWCLMAQMGIVRLNRLEPGRCIP